MFCLFILSNVYLHRPSRQILIIGKGSSPGAGGRPGSPPSGNDAVVVSAPQPQRQQAAAPQAAPSSAAAPKPSPSSPGVGNGLLFPPPDVGYNQPSSNQAPSNNGSPARKPQKSSEPAPRPSSQSSQGSRPSSQSSQGSRPSSQAAPASRPSSSNKPQNAPRRPRPTNPNPSNQACLEINYEYSETCSLPK